MNHTIKLTIITALSIAAMVTASQAAALNVMHSLRGSSQGVSNAGNGLDPIYWTLTGLTVSQYGVLGTSSAITNEGLATSVSVQDVTFSNHPTCGDITSDLRGPAVDSAGVFAGGDGKGGRISKMQYDLEVTTIDEPSNVIFYGARGFSLDPCAAVGGDRRLRWYLAKTLFI